MNTCLQYFKGSNLLLLLKYLVKFSFWNYNPFTKNRKHILRGPLLDASICHFMLYDNVWYTAVKQSLGGTICNYHHLP